MSISPGIIELNNQIQYRIIPSVYPTINFFEDIVDPSEMEVLYKIESYTNDRIREEIGDIFLIPSEDRVSGSGSSIVMAAFTHIHKPSRFTDGSYGIYYAGLSKETAIRETVYHRERFMKSTNEDPSDLTMRVYEGQIIKHLHDIRDSEFSNLHAPDNHIESQGFGRLMRDKKSWGLIYNSIRHIGGSCIAIFRPPAISFPKQTLHLKYHWNGEKIFAVSSTEIFLQFD
jgi:hypothetical protein